MENTFGETVKRLREENNLLLRELSAKLEIDMAVLSKIENNNRIAKKDLIERLAKVFDTDYNQLLIIWLSDKVFNALKNEENIDEILKIAEQKIKNGK